MILPVLGIYTGYGSTSKLQVPAHEACLLLYLCLQCKEASLLHLNEFNAELRNQGKSRFYNQAQLKNAVLLYHAFRIRVRDT